MKKSILLLFSLLLVFSACKKSVEGETNKWATNLSKANDMKALYPAFSVPIDDVIDRATDKWDAAKDVSDEEQKIAAMAEANSELNSGFIGKLRSIDDDISKLRKKMSEMDRVAKDAADRSRANIARDGANRIIDDVNRRLRSGATDEATALTIASRCSSDLQVSLKDVKRVIADAKSKQRKDNKKDTKTTKSTNDAAASGDKKVASTWKCAYCSKTNKADAVECAGCGASK